MQTKNILLFSTTDKKAKVSVFFQDGTFWLTQKAMAELFGVNVPAISKHLKNIFETGELESASRGCIKSNKNANLATLTVGSLMTRINLFLIRVICAIRCFEIIGVR